MEINAYIIGRKKNKDMEKFELAKKKYNVLLLGGEELFKLGIINNLSD